MNGFTTPIICLMLLIMSDNNHNNKVSAKLMVLRSPTLPNGRPDSSSSFFAPIENLTDSTIRTKSGIILQPPPPLTLPLPHYGQPVPPRLILGPNPLISPSLTINSSSTASISSNNNNNDMLNYQTWNDALTARHEEFDSLIERLLLPITQRKVFSPDQSKLVDGFLGNGKAVAADINNRTVMQFFRNNKTFASIVYTNQHHQRRLINCHLVDLERHLSDVALFETRYDMKTIDIEFDPMMNLIESCTNIARQRRKISNKPLATTLVKQQQQQQQQQGSPPARMTLPVIVGPSSTNNGGFVVAPSPKQPAPSQFQQVMSNQLSRELSSINMNPPPPPLSQVRSSSRTLSLLTSPIIPGRTVSGKSNAEQLLQQQQQQQQQQQLHHQSDGQQTPQKNYADGIAKITTTSSSSPSTSPSSSSSSDTIREAIQEISSYDTRDLLAIWRGILPGTNWCGMGDRATSYNDLGIESDLDICCRAHDFCPIRLNAFSKGYGLFNWSFYTRSHCLCDQNFLVCLKQAQTPLADIVARFYFNIMKTTCIHDNETSIESNISSPLGPDSVVKFDLNDADNSSNMHRHQQQQQQQQQQQRQQQHQHQGEQHLMNTIWQPIRAAKSSMLIDSVVEAKPVYTTYSY